MSSESTEGSEWRPWINGLGTKVGICKNDLSMLIEKPVFSTTQTQENYATAVARELNALEAKANRVDALSTEGSEWEQLESSLHAHYRNLKTGEVLSGMQCLERLNALQAKARQVDTLVKALEEARETLVNIETQEEPDWTDDFEVPLVFHAMQIAADSAIKRIDAALQGGSS